jgi:hypothetical protein
MDKQTLNYEIFFRYYEKFKDQAFENIDPADPLSVELENKLKSTGQFFHFADLIKLEINFFF